MSQLKTAFNLVVRCEYLDSVFGPLEFPYIQCLLFDDRFSIKLQAFIAIFESSGEQKNGVFVRIQFITCIPELCNESGYKPWY